MYEVQGTLTCPPTPPHPTPPHPTPQSRYSKTCVLRERFSVRRHKQECMGYLSVCPLLDTGIPPCTFHPEIRWCHCPLFRSESVCQRTSTMSESHGKPWKAMEKSIGNPPKRRFVASGLPVIRSLFFSVSKSTTGPAQFCWSCATSFGLWPGPLGEGHGLPTVFFGILRSKETCETVKPCLPNDSSNAWILYLEWSWMVSNWGTSCIMSTPD